jgi:hypothetical protein
METLLILSSLLTTLTAQAGLYEKSPLKTLKMIMSPKVDTAKTNCVNNLPAATRKMLFNYFNTAASGNVQNAEVEKAKYAKLCGMIYKESSGNPAAYTDMKYNGVNKGVKEFYKRKGVASIELFRVLRENETVNRNFMTNFGLLQISADILTWREQLRPIFESTVATASANPEKALEMCGTKDVFSDSDSALIDEMMKYKNCKLKYRKNVISKTLTKPVISEDELKCFESWVTYCPYLNLALGDRLPMAFYETRNAAPLCDSELTQIISSAKKK